MAITKLQSARDFFRIWFYWKKQAIFVFLLIVGLIMFYAYTTTPLYESNAKVLVLPKTNEGEVISAGSEEKKIMPVKTNDVFTEVELINSTPVLEDTIKSLTESGLDPLDKKMSLGELLLYPFKKITSVFLHLLRLTPAASSETASRISALRGAMQIKPIIDSNVISLSLRGPNKEITTATLEGVLKNYLKHRREVFIQKDGFQFYEDQAKEYSQKLDAIDKELRDFQKEGQIVNMQAQNQANILLLSKLFNDLKLMEISYDEANSRISMLQRKLIMDPENIHLTKEMRNIPAIFELEKGIVPILINRSEISKTFTTESREYKAVNSQIQMLRENIIDEVRKAINTDKLELESMAIKIVSLKESIRLLQFEANEFNQKEQALLRLENQAKMYQDSYLLYKNKADDANMYKEKTKRDLANVSISESPTISERPVYPNRLMLLTLSILFGAFASFCTPFILESIDNKIKTTDDVESLLELPVICSFSEVE